MNQTRDFTGKGDARALAESETPHVLVEFLVPHHQSHLGRADVRGLHQNVMNVHLAVTVVIAKNAASVGKRAVLAVDEGFLA